MWLNLSSLILLDWWSLLRSAPSMWMHVKIRRLMYLWLETLIGYAPREEVVSSEPTISPMDTDPHIVMVSP